VVTLLFTDLVGSTRLLERLGDDAAHEVVETHFRLLRGAIAGSGGREVKSLGDGVMVAFTSPVDALHCAVAMQESVAHENGRHPDRAVLLRVGLHSGEPLRAPWLRSREEDYFGTAVVVAKRLCDQASGGQILASEVVTGLVGSRGGFRFRPARRFTLKGIDEPVAAVEVETPTSPAPVSATTVAAATASLSARGPRIVDRLTELTALEAELDRAVAGEFRCALVVADPGIGKTRLAGELLARHQGRVLGLAARAHELAETTSFGLWAEALERHLRGLSAETVSQLCGGFLDDLASLLRSVAVVRGSVPDREPSRTRLLEGLLVLLGNLAEVAPVMVVLDDVHWADTSSWECLAYLARNGSDTRIQVVAAARPGELADRRVANEVILGLEQDGLLRRVELGPLDSQSVGDLAAEVTGQPPAAALVDWLSSRSGGNALFALGLLQALLDEGADLSAPRLRNLPERLADRVRTRLGTLDAVGLATMEILAVSGRRARHSDLVALTGRTPGELTPVLESLVRSRLVVEEERDRQLTYEIAHPLIQEIVYWTIGGARRRGLHRVMGRTLLGSRRLGEAASHFVRSAEVGDAEAVSALCEAVRQADKREAYGEALTILGALVEMLPSGDPRWLQVADAMTSREDWVLYHRADVQADAALRAIREIDAVLERSADVARRATAKLRLSGFLAWGTGELEEAEEVCRAAVELFDQAGDTARMLLAANELAYIEGLRGDLAAWEDGARRVVEDADAAGERIVVMQAVGALGFAAFWRGRFAEAEAAHRRGVAMAEGKPYRLTWSLASLALSLAVEGRSQEASVLLEQAKTASPSWRDGMVLEQETTIGWITGDYPAALASTRESAALNPAPSKRRAIGMALGALSAIEADALPEARRHLARAWAACGDRPWFFYSEYCSYVDAILAWREGRLSEALDGLRGVVSRTLRWDTLPFLCLVLLELADVSAEAGDAAGAAEAASRLEQIAERIDRDLYRALGATATAWARLAAGTPDSAAEQARLAVALLEGKGYRGFLGRAYDVLGRALVSADSAAARDAFGRSEASFDSGGARWRRRRMLETRRDLGIV
jgi:class 3 adenylate cyclase/tetratricopeptide (TPR) repeat protein